MLDTVFTTISRYSMLTGGERLIVAVSGGPDSVCLLEVLASLAPRLNVTLTGVAHFNHKLRGRASDEDESFVAALAARHGIAFYRVEGKFDAGGNLEQEARKARRQFFHDLIRQGRADRIALGHTRDDQAETVLHRMLRGSGLAGLAGILPVTREGLIRPLLDCSRIEIEAYLRSRGLRWREDQTNLETRFTRNRIRRDLLPSLTTEYNPRVSESLAQLAEMAQDEEAWWTAEIERLAKKVLVVGPDAVELRAAALASLPKAVGRRVVRHAIAAVKGDLRQVEFQHVERVLALAAMQRGTGQAVLPGITATRSLDWMRLAIRPVGPISTIPVEVPGCYAWPFPHSKITLEVTESKGLLGANPGRNPYGTLEFELCWNRIRGPLQLRGWRSGDAYKPQGRARVHQMTELFQDFRVPSWQRASWPILSYRDGAVERGILWARGFGAAHDLAAGEDAGLVLSISEK